MQKTMQATREIMIRQSVNGTKRERKNATASASASAPAVCVCVCVYERLQQAKTTTITQNINTEQHIVSFFFLLFPRFYFICFLHSIRICLRVDFRYFSPIRYRRKRHILDSIIKSFRSHIFSSFDFILLIVSVVSIATVVVILASYSLSFVIQCNWMLPVIRHTTHTPSLCAL